MDMAQSILGGNIGAINQDGSIVPVENESSFDCEPGHAAMALGEFHRATGLTEIDGKNIVDLTAACITAQTNDKEYTEDGLAYSSLGLLAFGPSKERNLVWEKLSEETRKNLDKRLLSRSDYEDHLQIFNIAKAVARFSMGLSKKDETGKLIDKFLERIDQTSRGKYFDDKPASGIDGVFDIYGIVSTRICTCATGKSPACAPTPKNILESSPISCVPTVSAGRSGAESARTGKCTASR